MACYVLLSPQFISEKQDEVSITLLKTNFTLSGTDGGGKDVKIHGTILKC